MTLESLAAKRRCVPLSSDTRIRNNGEYAVYVAAVEKMRRCTCGCIQSTTTSMELHRIPEPSAM